MNAAGEGATFKLAPDEIFIARAAKPNRAGKDLKSPTPKPKLNNMRKDVNIFHVVSNKLWGGPELYVADLVAQLKADGIYTEIVSAKNDNIIQQFRRLEVPISILPLRGLSDFDSPGRLARLIKRGNNIVHVHSLKDAVTAVFARKISENPKTKIVFTSHAIERPKTSFIYRKVYREIDKIIFVSQLSYDEFMANKSSFDKRKAVVINDSIRPMHFAETAAAIDVRSKFNIPSEKVLICCHGRVCKEKGVDVLVKALSKIDKNTYHLIIVGEEMKKFANGLRDYIRENNMEGNVTFMGFVENVASIIDQCDFGVLPAVWREPFGLGNLQYMLHGKCHVATNNGGPMEYLTDGKNALLVNPNDVDQLAATIKQLIENPSLRKQIGESAKAEFARKLSYEHFYKKLMKVYQEQ